MGRLSVWLDFESWRLRCCRVRHRASRRAPTAAIGVGVRILHAEAAQADFRVAVGHVIVILIRVE